MVLQMALLVSQHGGNGIAFALAALDACPDAPPKPTRRYIVTPEGKAARRQFSPQTFAKRSPLRDGFWGR